jgi:hypothetical protein
MSFGCHRDRTAVDELRQDMPGVIQVHWKLNNEIQHDKEPLHQL